MSDNERRDPWLGLTESDTRILGGGIIRAIRELKADSVTGCSYANLRQLTRTPGLTCSKANYLAAFNVVAYLAAIQLNFELYEAGLN